MGSRLKMKTSKRFIVSSLVALAAATCTPTVSAEPPTPEEIEASVASGLAWLVAQESPADSGIWGDGTCEEVAYTGMVMTKLVDRAHDLGFQDPLDGEYEYSGQVARGLAFIVSQAKTQAIGAQGAGNPDGDGDGYGVYWQSCWGYHLMYNTGIATMALAAAGNHLELVQDAVDFLAWAQADPNCDSDNLHRGGWRYNPNECSSDNSNSGWVTLGLGYAQAAGITVPAFVKSELSVWIDQIQDDVNGDSDDGGSWYDPYWSTVNIYKTGNLLYEMGLVGDNASTQRVKDAVDYIERQWYGSDSYWCGSNIGQWRDNRQAMFAMMKGLESLGIEMLDLNNDGVAETNWFDEVAGHLIETQNVDGSWPWDCWANPVMSTAWALLTLEKAVPAFEIQVPVDVKPTSCPNPLNVTSKGVVPVAILGTENLDVTTIDPASVKLVEEVAPLRWSLEDVAAPFIPFVDKPLDAYACTMAGPDGYMDLVFHFNTQAVVEAIGMVSDGDVLKLMLTGNLMEEEGGTPIVGEDVVKILKKK
jgi:hypothetical protein